jgi:hypothetical protein
MTTPVIIENRSVAGSRPARCQASATRARIVRHSSDVEKTTLYSSAHRAASRALLGPASPPMISGG